MTIDYLKRMAAQFEKETMANIQRGSISSATMMAGHQAIKLFIEYLQETKGTK